jgi:hypothetical protein
VTAGTEFYDVIKGIRESLIGNKVTADQMIKKIPIAKTTANEFLHKNIDEYNPRIETVNLIVSGYGFDIIELLTKDTKDDEKFNILLSYFRIIKDPRSRAAALAAVEGIAKSSSVDVETGSAK